MPANWWQPGCPFFLKDVVYTVDAKQEGKVIGLPGARPVLPPSNLADTVSAAHLLMSIVAVFRFFMQNFRASS